MAKHKSKPKVPPRQVGDFLVTDAVAAPRKRSKRLPDPDQGHLFADRTANDQEVKREVGAAEASARSAAVSEHRTAAAGGSVPLFQYYGHCCDNKEEAKGLAEGIVRSPEDVGPVVGRAYRIRPCHCRKWFCEWCGPRLGWNLRHRLQTRLKAFKSVYGVTLTVDGSHFQSPLQSWGYVMDNRFLPRLVRDLERRSFLISPAYFWVVEFQTKTQQPHWHMLLDAEFIPYGDIVEIWSRFRPLDAKPLAERITSENYQGQAPAFGSVRYSKPTNLEKASYYATKYLTKYPSEGYPDWVLDRKGRMPRYGHSHKFFPRKSDHDAMCFCAECRGDVEPVPKPRVPKKPDQEKRISKPSVAATIRERLEQCGQSCSIVSVDRVELSDGTVLDGRGKFAGTLKLPFREACEFLEIPTEDCWQIEADLPAVIALEELAKERGNSREAA